MEPPRIVSLLPSATEIVCALGLRAALVGRSHECDYPLDVSSLPVCTAPKFKPEGTSAEIDQRVRTLLREALAIYQVDADLLARLAPTHIVTQTQCQVCACSLEDVERAVCELLPGTPQILALSPEGLPDLFADMDMVAHELRVDERGRELVFGLRGRMRQISHQARGITLRPRVALIEWIEPLMAAGNWMPELVELAGGVILFGEAGKHSPWLSWDQLAQADPDVIVVLPCGFSIERTREELHLLTGNERWPALKAVREGRVFVADGNQYFNRPGPRVAESLEILAEILHPEVFKFGHEGTGWQRLSA